jgi:hypothetical protein
MVDIERRIDEKEKLKPRSCPVHEATGNFSDSQRYVERYASLIRAREMCELFHTSLEKCDLAVNSLRSVTDGQA